MLSFKPTFSLSSFTFIKRLFSSSSLSAIRVVSGFPVHHQLWSLLKLMSIESVMPSNHLILCCPLLILPSIFPSIRVFSNELALLIRWPKYWSFTFNISPSNDHSGLISFRMDWLDLLAVQETLKSLLQYHSSKASTLQCSTFFIVQLSHPHMTTGKAIALTLQTFVGKVMSLHFNTLSRFIITFLPRSKHLLISSPHYLASIITNSWGLSCGPAVESALQMHRSRIQTLVWELRSHMLWSN